MDIISKDYKLEIYDKHDKLIYKARPEDLYHAIHKFLDYLRMYNALDLAESGSFIVTQTPVKKHEVIKRYEVYSILPYCRFVIRKISKGSIDVEGFKAVLSYIKGGMNARVRHKTTDNK